MASAIQFSLRTIIRNPQFYGANPRNLAAAIPQHLNGRYRVLDVIGEGMSGEVFKAQDTLTGKDVAIKVLDFNRFYNCRDIYRAEVKALGLLPTHQSLIGTVETKEVTDTGLIVMDYAQGLTLEQIIEQRIRIPALEALEIIAQIARGLAVAAREGEDVMEEDRVYHKDIKPQNITVQKDGTVKLLDFGISKYEPRPGCILGSEHYLAPEQFRGATVDHRADIQALGLVLYKMIAGKTPYSDEATIIDIWQIRESGQLPIIPEYEQYAPQAVQQLIAKMTAKEAANRQQSYRELLTEIETVKEQIKDLEARVADLEGILARVDFEETELTRAYSFTPNGTRIIEVSP